MSARYQLIGTRTSYAVLSRDPLSARLLSARAPDVAKWVERMQCVTPRSGSFLADDKVPQTLEPILRAMFADQFPVLHETIGRVRDWARDNPGAPFPKTIGRHNFVLRGRKGTRCVYPYRQWMLQRALDHYHTAKPSEREAIDARLRALGGLDAMIVTIAQPVARVGFKLMPVGTPSSAPHPVASNI